jgi:hypothetical protein
MSTSASRSYEKLTRENMRAVKKLYPHLTQLQLGIVRELTRALRLSLRSGDLLLLDGKWYVTHSGLLRVAQRRRCKGINTEIIERLSSPSESKWIFKATVLKSDSHYFVGYGDADPSNVSPVVHGSEMRIAETRAVNRALRKAYAVGICSLEEIGPIVTPDTAERQVRKAPQNANGNGSRIRDRLCQLIRQHSLDAELVKAYATDFCGTKILREATREQVVNFVAHLADWAEKDRNALICQLNSYARPQQEGAA